MIGLKAKDKEFVEEFDRCLAKVLGRREIRPRYRRSSGRYVVEVESKTLYELLKKPVELDRLKKYIEHCDICVAAFIRASQTQKDVLTRGVTYVSSTPTRDYSHISMIFLGDWV
jgi:hypothetical protein